MTVIVFTLAALLGAGNAAAQAPNAATGSTVAFQFSSQDEMKQFTALIQERQIVETKIAVLEEYLAKERERRDSLSGQLLLKYKIDPKVRYQLDPEKLQVVVVAEPKSAIAPGAAAP